MATEHAPVALAVDVIYPRDVGQGENATGPRQPDRARQQQRLDQQYPSRPRRLPPDRGALSARINEVLLDRAEAPLRGSAQARSRARSAASRAACSASEAMMSARSSSLCAALRLMRTMARPAGVAGGIMRLV